VQRLGDSTIRLIFNTYLQNAGWKSRSNGSIACNGETVIKMNMPELPETGAIGLQQHSPGRDAVRPFPIEFRNILIKEL